VSLPCCSGLACVHAEVLRPFKTCTVHLHLCKQVHMQFDMLV